MEIRSCYSHSSLENLKVSCHGSVFSPAYILRHIASSVAHALCCQTTTINGRKVSLLRHIPGLGSLDYLLFEGALVKLLIKSPPVCQKLRHDQILVRATQSTAMVVLPAQGSNAGGYESNYADSGGGNDKALYLRLALAVPAMLLTNLFWGETAFWGSAFLSILWVLKTPEKLFLRHCVDDTEELNIKGVVINNFHVEKAREKLKLIRSQADTGKLTYNRAGFNCSQMANDQIRAGIDTRVAPHLSAPLLFYTPLNIAFMSYNIEQIDHALYH